MSDHDPNRLPPVHPSCDADTAVGFAWVLAAIVGGLSLWGIATFVWRFLVLPLITG
jgi:hypothetical protein